ncbi:MAG: hypothetical protein ACO1NS_06580 [Daejeonella sp.]|uniref:hypothetical protein n=1 Tax=Daejeonella sp. JGW-45 TaxID=3034148 RepID=UPI0023EC64C7|nr:hypothetical protein [Daejeonella sp. JGW-45]
MSVSEIKLYQILKDRLGNKEAEALVHFVSSEIKNEFDNRKEIFATKDDVGNVKSDLTKSIYVVGLIQFLAITGSVLAIINFIIK